MEETRQLYAEEIQITRRYCTALIFKCGPCIYSDFFQRAQQLKIMKENEECSFSFENPEKPSP